MADVLNFPAADDIAIDPDPVEDLAIEPEIEPGIEPEPAPEPPAAAIPAGLISTALVEILPADFPLPLLARFIPNPALKLAAEQAASRALALAVTGEEGLQAADVALDSLRRSLKAIEDHFEEPTKIAHDLHKRLTTIRSDWQASAKNAVQLVGAKVWTEQKRLDAIAAEERRRAQDEADRLAREERRREAEAAAKAQAPAPVVEELKRQAETATAPPVAARPSAQAMRNTSTVTTWKARIIGTPGSDDPNPDTAELSDAQRLKVFELLKGILDGKDPLVAIQLDWSYLNARSKADQKTMAISGLEAFEQGSARAKSSRSR